MCNYNFVSETHVFAGLFCLLLSHAFAQRIAKLWLREVKTEFLHAWDGTKNTRGATTISSRFQIISQLVRRASPHDARSMHSTRCYVMGFKKEADDTRLVHRRESKV
jgi:hypothetical protein